jgi:hypothetical protein
MEELRNRVFVGVVEDNNDPKKIGRCRVRVTNVFDDIPKEDIPWATPWKDLNGNSAFIPEVGKVVSVVFDSGVPYKPEYICAEHYNANLEQKLQQLSGSNYTSMRALMFDHKTQIYSNDGEGLKIDYKYNNINVTEDSINLNLKDTMGRVNVGTQMASQQAILGNHFLDWFDEFVGHLMGMQQGPYIGVVPVPAFVRCLQKYNDLKTEIFLSHNVYLNDNLAISPIVDRIANGQVGDAWKSTVKDNPVTVEEIDFKPSDSNSTETPSETGSGTETQKSLDKLVEQIVEAMKVKKYIIYEEPYKLNIVGIRKQYEGDNYSNVFKDDLVVFYKNDKTEWEKKKYKFSTMPGFYSGEEKEIKKTDTGANLSEEAKKLLEAINQDFGGFIFLETGKVFSDGSVAKDLITIKQSKKLEKGLQILRPCQLIDTYTLDKFRENDALISDKPQPIFLDKTPEKKITYSAGLTTPEWTTDIFITRADVNTINVSDWSRGSQIFDTHAAADEFFELCKKHKEKYTNSFTYTLIEERDLPPITSIPDIKPSTGEITGSSASETLNTTTNLTTTTGTTGSTETTGSTGSETAQSTEPPANITFRGDVRLNPISGVDPYMQVWVSVNGEELASAEVYEINYKTTINGKEYSGIEGAIEDMKFRFNNYGLYILGKTYKPGQPPLPGNQT